MIRILTLFTLLAGLLTAACSSAPERKFKASGVALPDHYRAEFVRYARVDRIDGTIREIYINRSALEAARLGQPLPDDTVIVIEAFNALTDAEGKFQVDDAGRLIKGAPLDMVHVAEKRADWTEADFVSSARSGKWNFGSYAYNSPDAFDEDLNACFNCHNAESSVDFLYTYRLLFDFRRSGEVAYFRCSLAGRIAC